MAGTLNLTIRTPGREFFNGEITELITENESGKIGILHDHAPMITSIIPCITTIKAADGKELRAFTSSGLLNVNRNVIEMMCDTCEWPEEIDVQRAQEARRRAEDRLEKDQDVDRERAEIALKKAITRIRVKE